MNHPITIHDLSEKLGLTSRTLRHWESEGLFQSTREIDSGWRTYDINAVLCIQITALLRKFDIPIKEIKSVLETKTFETLYHVINNRILEIQSQKAENFFKENQLKYFLSLLSEHKGHLIDDKNLPKLLEYLTFSRNSPNTKEDFLMPNTKDSNRKLKVISLPQMRMVYNIAVSVSPEDEAMVPVIDFIKSANLIGTARLFGGNMKPMPSDIGKPYGYGMCASIPNGVVVPDSLKEMSLPGGLYAMLEGSDDIGGSWKALMKCLSADDKYESDHSRLCLEEHIRNDNPDGCGNKYYLNLLEPVKIKV